MMVTDQERKVKRLLVESMCLSSVIAGPYSFINESFFKEQTKSAVRHRETCPVCGKKLVNLYWRKSGWKCRACWEQFEKDAVLKEMGIAVFNADGSRKSDDEFLEAIREFDEKISKEQDKIK